VIPYGCKVMSLKLREEHIVTGYVGNTSNNLRILDLMPDLLVIRQAELQLNITIAVSL
jgi:hypothetical protein